MTTTNMTADHEFMEPRAKTDNDTHQSSGLSNQIRLLAVLLVTSLALTVALLFWFAHSQDKVAAANARHLAQTAVTVQTNNLQKILTDYTWWDEAYQKLVTNFDTAWFDENFAEGDYLGDTFGITTSFLAGPDKKMLRHMRDSEIVTDGPNIDTATYFSGGVDALIQQAKRKVDDEYKAAVGLVRLNGEFYFAAVRVVHPHSEELLAKADVKADNAFVAAFMRPLDNELLQTIGRDFGLQALRRVAADDPSSRLPLPAANGDEFVALTWELDLPSRYVLGVILPGLLAVVICIGLLGWYVLNRLRRDQAEIFVAMQQAKFADRSKTEFLANMSHELRTPLNAIIGFSEIMRNESYGPMGDSRYGEYTGHIRDSGLHLLDIINDLLELSRVEAGKYILEESAVDVEITTDAVAKLIGPTASENSITLAVEIAENLPALFADERAIKQIELNLLSNAVKFTPAGGNVVMRVAMLENGAMELSVADTGRGIPTDQLPLVMQPFHQVSGPLTRETGGTGLGLPLCASLVALHGGRMHVDSEVDKGTSVTITFPAERIRP